MGESSPFLEARDFIHAASFHSYSSVHTREPVAGGNSEKNPKGSALSTT